MRVAPDVRTRSSRYRVGGIRTLAIAAALTATIAAPVGLQRSARVAPPVTPSPAVHDSSEALWIPVRGGPIKATLYRSADLARHPTLVVVLHGDLLDPREVPSYHYAFAHRVAIQNTDVVVAALLRPGYTDGAGDQSGGWKGHAAGDNYTPEVIDTIGRAIDELRQRVAASATVLVGHSGGATIAADLIGRQPRDLNAALLVSCPCDVGRWRRHMAWNQVQALDLAAFLFLLPAQSLSPIDLVPNVPTSVAVDLVVGAQDAIAPPVLTEQYAAALRRRGITVTTTIAPGLGHNILLSPPVFQRLRGLLNRLGGAATADSTAGFHRSVKAIAQHLSKRRERQIRT